MINNSSVPAKLQLNRMSWKKLRYVKAGKSIPNFQPKKTAFFTGLPWFISSTF